MHELEVEVCCETNKGCDDFLYSFVVFNNSKVIRTGEHNGKGK